MSVAAERSEEGAFPEVQVASRVLGTGYNLPEQVITNDYFASYLDTSDEWIRERTGIRERRWVEGDVSASELAEPAARTAISRAGLNPEDIDGIVFATVTPDYAFPSSAAFLQRRLGCRGGLAFDVNAVCSGFLYAITAADALISKGVAKNVLVVGCDIYSKIIDKNDRRTCILFGDGAGALVLQASEESSKAKSGQCGGSVSGSGESLRGIYAAGLGADGKYTDILSVPRGTAAPVTPESLQSDAHFLKMDGREVFKLAVRRLAEINGSIVRDNNFDVSQVDWFVSHQANQRILDAMARSLGAPREKVLSNVETVGNTSAASVPILLAEAEEQGKIKAGDLVVLSAFGGGVTWGSMLLRW